MTLRFSELASHNLENIYTFIALDNPDAALEMLERLFASIRQLESFPKLGHITAFDARRLILTPYVVVYRIVEDVVNIEAIFHGSQRQQTVT